MIWLLLILLTPDDGETRVTWSGRKNLRICGDNEDIKAYFKFPVQPQNQYTFNITREIEPNSRMILRFDSKVSLNLIEPANARISMFPGPTQRSNQFIVTFTDKTSLLLIQVFGPASGLSLPYALSVILNNVELCTEPKIGYFDDEIKFTGNFYDDTKLILEEGDAEISYIDESCGRRKVVHTDLIVHGQPTQPGDWPWHAAIKWVEGPLSKYVCGGTLLTKTLVLTAAHCATRQGNPVVPNSISIELGKYNLYGGNEALQERGVFEVIVHPEFDVNPLNNDIALLKLKSEAVFTDYVQPACLWHTALLTEEVVGTVVGWGFDHQEKLSSTLRQITIPIVSDLTCLKSDPIFFNKKLNTNKFCAGFANGTSVCNGDSGGGLMVFVPDSAGDTGRVSGTWYVRGIVSLALKKSEYENVCDPFQYTIFTDVDKYLDWLLEYL